MIVFIDIIVNFILIVFIVNTPSHYRWYVVYKYIWLINSRSMTGIFPFFWIRHSTSSKKGSRKESLQISERHGQRWWMKVSKFTKCTSWPWNIAISIAILANPTVRSCQSLNHIFSIGRKLQISHLRPAIIRIIEIDHLYWSRETTSNDRTEINTLQLHRSVKLPQINIRGPVGSIASGCSMYRWTQWTYDMATAWINNVRTFWMYTTLH